MRSSVKETDFNSLKSRLELNEVPILKPDQTISEVFTDLKKSIDQLSTVDYFYIVNLRGNLVGVISIKELLQIKDRKQTISSVMRINPITVRPSTKDEKVAVLALHNNIKMLPVVNKRGKLLRIIPQDEIVRIIDRESVKNLLLFGGILPPNQLDNTIRLPLYKSVTHRLPWLLLGLVGGLLAAGIVGEFENTLSENIILASFIPLIVYMADAFAAQMQAFIIRDLAITANFNFAKYILKHALVVLLLASLISVILLFVANLAYDDTRLSLVLAGGLFLATIASLISGVIIPYFFNQAKLDPANASGPVATIIQDILSISIFLIVASFIL